MRYPSVSDNTDIQEFYEYMRAKGESHSMADMLAHRMPTGASGTDRAMFEGDCNGNQFEDDPIYGGFVKAKAQAAGVDTTGRRYLSALADHPGDVTAWVQDVADVKRVCREKGLSCDGAVSVKAPQYLNDAAPIGVADDIVEEAVVDRLVENPWMQKNWKKNLPDIMQQVKSEISPEV